MSNDPVEPGEGANDLLGRWLAHHDKAADDGTASPPPRSHIAARPSEAAAPRTTRPSASALTPPSTFGVRRALPGSAPSGGDVAELDRPSPVGFEPVILRSMRKKSEAKEEEERKDKRSRLSRLRSRVAESVEQPAPPEEEHPVALHDEPVALIAPPVFKSAPATPAAPPRKLVPYEDVIALAATASLPVAEPAPVVPEPVVPEPVVPEPEPEVEPILPGPDTVPEPVVPEPVVPEPEPEVEPILPGPDTVPDPVVPEPVVPEAVVAVKVPSKRRLLTRTKRPEPEEAAHRKRHPLVARSAKPTNTGTGGAARGLLAAARAATPAPTLASQTRPAPKKVEPVPMLAVETVAESPVPSAPAMEMPAIYEFAPRKSSRRFLSLMLLAGLTASGLLGYGAYQSRDTIEIGIAGIATLVTLVIWAIRAGATVTRLTIRSGQLEITRQGGRVVFDLASTYTSIEVVGKPGSKSWKVLLVRRGMAPVMVDSTMVDGRDFMRVVGFFRPEVA